MKHQNIEDIIRSYSKGAISLEAANAALKEADYAFVLQTGMMGVQGTGAELLDNPEVKAAYLGKSRK